MPVKQRLIASECPICFDGISQMWNLLSQISSYILVQMHFSVYENKEHGCLFLIKNKFQKNLQSSV